VQTGIVEGLPESDPTSVAWEVRAKTVDVVLAEYAALRATLVAKLGHQLTAIGLNITAIAAIGGVVLANRVDSRLLLLLPFLSAAMGLYYRALEHDFTTIARYVYDVQRPMLTEILSENGVLDHYAYYRARRNTAFFPKIAALALMFPLIAVATLVLVAPALRSFSDWATWVLGVVVTLIQIGAWLFAPRPAPDAEP